MDIVYEKSTDKNLNDAIESLKENLEKKDFGYYGNLTLRIN